MLQKGIYTQETLGDLDAAIQIYRQIVAAHAQSRADTAQALFRLGQCLVQKRDEAGAAKIFQQLVQEFPEQKDLAVRAKEYLPGDLKLLPVPWGEDELADYQIKLPGGQPIGRMLFTTEAVPARPQNALVTIRAYQLGVPIQESHVEVDRESMRPVAAAFLNRGIVIESQADYEAGQVRLQVKGKDAKVVPLDVPYFDNEEALFLFRRLPLTGGYKATLPIVSPIGVPIKLKTSVTGIEDVQVEAGKFRCYKLDTGILQQTYWVGMDAPHPIVKFETNGALVELERIGKIDRITPLEYRDAKTGLSLTAPAGWMVSAIEMPSAERGGISMLDPQAQAQVTIQVQAVNTETAQIAGQLRTGFETLLKTRAGQFKDYRPRPDSVQTRLVGNQQALTGTIDYLEGSVPMTENLIAIWTEASHVLVMIRVSPSELTAFQKRFEPILSSLRVK